MAGYMDWKLEKENMHRLKALVDRICGEITQGRIMDEGQLAARMEEARKLCSELFPGREQLFDRLYKSRFTRLWEQFGSRGAEEAKKGKKI